MPRTRTPTSDNSVSDALGEVLSASASFILNENLWAADWRHPCMV